ncbi:MAG: hypothetical protein AAFX62_17125 [Pseudomonadota bacterium]
MPKIPNNFPREGYHTPVTSDAVRRLEAERPRLNAELHYTIGGTVEAEVHSDANAEREAAITTGSRRLNQASAAMRAEFMHPRGDARAAYVREQQALAEHWRGRQRSKTPIR